jgi:MraZ protein
MAHIEQDVRFIGMDNTIEIWAKEMADKPFMAPETFEKELQKIMGTPIER